MRATSLIPTLLALAATAAGAECNHKPMAVADTVDSFLRPFVVAVTVNDTDVDGDALGVSYSSTTCRPETVVTVDLDVLRVTPSKYQETNCRIHYAVSDGRDGSGPVEVLVLTHSAIFADGFEAGSMSRWVVGTEVSNDPPEEDPAPMTVAGEV